MSCVLKSLRTGSVVLKACLGKSIWEKTSFSFFPLKLTPYSYQWSAWGFLSCSVSFMTFKRWLCCGFFFFFICFWRSLKFSFTEEEEGLSKPKASLAVCGTAGGLGTRGHRPGWRSHLMCLRLGRLCTKARLSNPGKAEKRK